MQGPVMSKASCHDVIMRLYLMCFLNSGKYQSFCMIYSSVICCSTFQNGSLGELSRHWWFTVIITMHSFSQAETPAVLISYIRNGSGLLRCQNTISILFTIWYINSDERCYCAIWQARSLRIQRCYSNLFNSIKAILSLDGWRIFHDDVIKWKQFPRYWPFVRGIHR